MAHAGFVVVWCEVSPCPPLSISDHRLFLSEGFLAPGHWHRSKPQTDLSFQRTTLIRVPIGVGSPVFVAGTRFPLGPAHGSE